MVNLNNFQSIMIDDNTLNIDFTKNQLLWNKVAAEVANNHLLPNAEKVDRDGEFPRDGIKEIAKAGLLGLLIPNKFGGPGGDITTHVLVAETLAQGCASTAMCYHMHTCAVDLIASLCENEQIEKFIDPIKNGQSLCTYATSEPGTGSRWWHMETYATKEDDHYTVNSLKSFATSAGNANLYVVTVKSTPYSTPNEMTIFLIEADRDGVKPLGKWDAMGMRGNASTAVQFDHCKVPEINKLGAAGYGFQLLMAYGLPAFQIGVAAVYLGVAQAAFKATLKHASSRSHADTGKNLASVETIQRYICEMKMRLDQARLSVYHAAKLIDKIRSTEGAIIEAIEDPGLLISLAEAKIIASEMAIYVTNTALQICGGIGYKKGHIVERAYRDARAGSIMGVNDDALKVILGQRMLGMPFPWQ